MKLRELKEGDVLIINGEANHRVHRFDCESSDGEVYYHFPEQQPFVKFTGREDIEHFSDNVYMLKENKRRANE
jgi:hypothetical protein